MRRLWKTGCAVILTSLLVVAGSSQSRAATTVHTGFGSDWPTYHGNSLATGVAAPTTAIPTVRAWVSPFLGSELYGEPLVDEGRVFAATEADTVFALQARTGQILWSRALGHPVPSADVECGDITPTVGITSTPIIDTHRHEIFVVANELEGSSTPAHHLVGLNLFTGAVELDQIVDPPGSNTGAQLQRPGLALDAGQVVMGFGSNAGDCNDKPYHGYVVAAPERGGAIRTFEVSTGPGRLFGSVWQSGASPIVDSKGNIWLATGNGEGVTPSAAYDRSDSVLELSPTLTVEQYFAPARWTEDNAVDADLGTTAPTFVDGYVFQVGKNRNAYLLDPKHLGGIGGDLATTPLCGTGTGVDYSASPFGGDAVDGSIVYVPCRDGVTAVRVQAGAPPSMRVLWTTPTRASGGPVLAGGLVWTVSQTGDLYGLSPTTGVAVVTERIGLVSNHFATPSVADGIVLAPGATEVYAFAGPAGLPPLPPPPPPIKSFVARTHLAILVPALILVVLGAGFWMARRRRRARLRYRHMGRVRS